MARTQTRTDEVICYRLLVESFYDSEWHETLVYGPYFKAGQARATIDGAENVYAYKERYLKGTRRCKVQMQDVGMSGENIVWVDVA
jgi:hypothetical protein